MKQIKNFKTNKSVKIALFIILGCALLIGAVFLGRHLYLNHLSNQPVVFSNVEYNSLKEIPEKELLDYYNLLAYIFEETTHDGFSDDDIAIVTAYYLLMWNTEDAPIATEQEVKDFVKMYFNISDYDLKPDTYILKQDNLDWKINIEKDGNRYTSDLCGKGVHGMYNKFVSKKVVGKQIILNYDFGYHGNVAPGDNHIEIVGHTKIYLESNGKTLFVKKIVYTPVK